MLISCVVEVAVHSWYTGDLRDVQADAIARVTKLFEPKMGSLGRMCAVDDISTCIKFDGTTRRNYIDYVRVLAPTEDIYPGSKLAYIALRSLRLSVDYSDRGQSDDVAI